MRIRTRQHLVPSPIQMGVSQYRDYPEANITYGSPTSKFYQTRELCADELHQGPPYKSGGPFNVWKAETDQYVPKGYVDVASTKYRYTGSLLPIHMPTSYLEWFNPQDGIDSEWGAGSDSLGATGWNKFRPTKSPADVAQFLGEIKEVPRMLKTTAKGFHNLWKSAGGARRTFSPKHVADHWLNHQFGWVPFLNDLRSFYETGMNYEKQVNQLHRDNDQWVKRGGSLEGTSESELVLSQDSIGHYPGLVTYLYSPTTPRGKVTVTRSNTTSAWFVARFRYHIPYGKDSGNFNKLRDFARVFGVRPSPSLLWELTPWSWLADWASNAGDIIANVSSMLADDLTAKYAYVMNQKIQKVTSTATTFFNPAYGGENVTCDWTASISRKSRWAASPFGFGLTGMDFSARQWSILTALGLSRFGR